MRTGFVLAAVAMAVPCAAAPSTPVVVTAAPLETLQQCARTKWADSGTITAINTAAGVMLDLAFEGVGADGKVQTGHVIFSIEDRGSERRVSAVAGDAADAGLAAQMLDQTIAACAPDVARR